MRYKKGIILVVTLGLAFIGFKAWNTYYINSMHVQISISDVESIKFDGRAIKNSYKIATEDEVKNVVTWFNSISNVRGNLDFQGTTADSHIIIILKSKKEILIAKSGRDFEIQRYNSKGRWISYWGKQADIRKILQEAAYE